MRRVIGVDLDDVLADFMPAYLRFAFERFGRPAIGSMPIDWEWSNILPDPEEQKLVWEDVKAVSNFWETLEVEQGVTPWLVRQLDAEHTVYFPTARVETYGPAPAARQSARWLQYKFGLQYPQVFAALDKKPMAAVLKYDYFIDDRPKNCLDIQSVLPECRVFLKDSSHNQMFKCAGEAGQSNAIVRVQDFNDFAKIVLEQEG